MENDYLHLKPLERDERLIQSLIRFCNPDYQPAPEARLQLPVHQRQESARNRLNLFIDETCKNVVNASCPVDDHPQQHQLNEYHLSQQQTGQQIENVSSVQNTQYQLYQMTACPQLYLPADSTAKLNTLYNPGPCYHLDQYALIHPRPTTNPFFRIVSSQSDLDCQLMEPPIIPTTDFLTTAQSSQDRQPLSEIQSQAKFNQRPEALVDSYGYPSWPHSFELANEPNLFALELQTENVSTQAHPNQSQSNEVPTEFRMLPDTLVAYFQATHNQSSDENSQPESQEKIEISLADNKELVKMLRYSRMACSQVRYSPKQFLYLNGLERLGNDELGSRLSLKPVQDQVKRIQKKNLELRNIKLKNRNTKNVDLRSLFKSARRQNLESRVRRIKRLVLDLEAKLLN